MFLYKVTIKKLGLTTLFYSSNSIVLSLLFTIYLINIA